MCFIECKVKPPKIVFILQVNRALHLVQVMLHLEGLNEGLQDPVCNEVYKHTIWELNEKC